MNTFEQEKPKIRLVIFDLDGTLVDSRKDLALGVNATREYLGLDALPLETVTSYIGHGVAALVKSALGEIASQENVEKGLAFFMDFYGRHLLDNTVAYPGIPEMLAGLGDRKLAILTNKPTRFSRDILEGLGLARYFIEICGGDAFPLKKPDPLGIHTLMKNLAVPAEQTLMVGDSDTDMLTGRNAGVWTCAVTYGYGLGKQAPDLLLENLCELPKWLNGRKA